MFLLVILLDKLKKMPYISIVMRNLELLRDGSKPAPGELIIVQGFVNTFDVESGADELKTRQQLKDWLVQYGLLLKNETVSEKDFRIMLSFREALRHLLLANNSGAASPADLKKLNEVASRYPLEVSFAVDGTFSLSTADQGIGRVFGQFLAQMVKAVVEGTWSRLKACNDPKCRWAFYDSSKNQSGRWCSMSVCGSRDKARAYRKRRSNQ